MIAKDFLETSLHDLEQAIDYASMTSDVSVEDYGSLQFIHSRLLAMLDVLKVQGKLDDDDEPEEDELPDDVDESNYDPYSGCDVYEVDEWY